MNKPQVQPSTPLAPPAPPPDLPTPTVRYVIMPSAEVTDAAQAEVRDTIENLVEQIGRVAIRVEFRFFDPLRHNNYTWLGKTLNIHFTDVAMAEAVVESVRDMLLRGQKVQGGE